MKKTLFGSFLSAATVLAAVAADPEPATLQVFPKNLARQHLGANLFHYSPTTQAYSPTQASAAWLDDDISTGWPMMNGKQYYLLAFPQAEQLSTFAVSAKAASGSISLYAGDEAAPPTGKSWALLAKDIPFDSINEKRLAKPLARTAKYMLIETNLNDPGPVYSLFVYGSRPAVAYDVRNREQAIEPRSIFGPYTNDATAFNVAGLYSKSFVRPQPGQSATDVQKAIDDNPESFVTIGGTQAATLEVKSAQPQTVSRVAVEVNPGAKGRLEFFVASDEASPESTTPAGTIVLDGSTSRASVDFPAVQGTLIRTRWTPANGSDAVKLHELNAFGGKTLATNMVTTSLDAIAANDVDGTTRSRTRDGKDYKDSKDARDPKDSKDAKEAIADITRGPYLPGALGFPPNPTLRRIPPPLPPDQPVSP